MTNLQRVCHWGIPETATIYKQCAWDGDVGIGMLCLIYVCYTELGRCMRETVEGKACIRNLCLRQFVVSMELSEEFEKSFRTA